MDFALPEHLPGLLVEMDEFIESEIKPLERENIQYFDQRREHARTDWDNGGIPRREWEDLLGEMRRRADAAGWLRYGLPSQFGGRDGTNIDMAVIREHLAHKGLGLHNDLQDESSIVGNFPQVIMMDRFGTDAQKKEWTDALITGERSMAFGKCLDSVTENRSDLSGIFHQLICQNCSNRYQGGSGCERISAVTR